VSKQRNVDGLAAVITTVASICALLIVRPPALAAYTLTLGLSLAAWCGQRDAIWVIAKWSVPFAAPLLLVHGVLNTGFPVDRWYFGFLPVRVAGLLYGVTVSLHVVLFATVAAYWMSSRRDEVVDDLVRLRLPPWLILFSSQSIAIGASVERRIAKVYEAQRARGIRTGPSLWARVQAFPTVLIPAVVGTLLEAEGRVPALVSRGFGCARLAPLPERRKPLSVRIWASLPAALLIGAILLDKATP
jgi:hypothetical protein